MAALLVRINNNLFVNWLNVTTVAIDDEGCAVINLVDDNYVKLTAAESKALVTYLADAGDTLDVVTEPATPPAQPAGNRFSDLVDGGT